VLLIVRCQYRYWVISKMFQPSIYIILRPYFVQNKYGRHTNNSHPQRINKAPPFPRGRAPQFGSLWPVHMRGSLNLLQLPVSRRQWDQKAQSRVSSASASEGHQKFGRHHLTSREWGTQSTNFYQTCLHTYWKGNKTLTVNKHMFLFCI
jgi:hypothetical protein